MHSILHTSKSPWYRWSSGSPSRLRWISATSHILRTLTTVFVLHSLFVLLLINCSGCSNFNLQENIPWRDTSDKPKIPGRITALWTHTILEQPGQKGIRGFGGRVMFHDLETEKPVAVAGNLVVYAFDDSQGPRSNPERKFVFPPEKLKEHYSRSRLGHSYSLWLPWDTVGGAPLKISLVVRFTPEGAGTLLSESAQVVLPGIDPLVKEEIQQAAANARKRAALATQQNKADAETGGIQQVNHTATHSGSPSTVNSPSVDRKMDVITLDVSPGLDHLLQAAPPENPMSLSPPVPDSPSPQTQYNSPRNPQDLSGQENPIVPETNAGLMEQTTLSQQVEERRPNRSGRPRHRAQALGGSLTERGRQSSQLVPSQPPSPATQQLSNPKTDAQSPLAEAAAAASQKSSGAPQPPL